MHTIHLTRLISQIYKKLIKLYRNQPNQKNGKRNNHSKKHTEMANWYMKKCLQLVIIREMKSRPNELPCHTCEKYSYGKEEKKVLVMMCGKKGNLLHCWMHSDLVLWKATRRLLSIKRLIMVCHSTQFSWLGIYPQKFKNINLKGNLHFRVYRNNFYYS